MGYKTRLLQFHVCSYFLFQIFLSLIKTNGGVFRFLFLLESCGRGQFLWQPLLNFLLRSLCVPFHGLFFSWHCPLPQAVLPLCCFSPRVFKAGDQISMQSSSCQALGGLSHEIISFPGSLPYPFAVSVPGWIYLP